MSNSNNKSEAATIGSEKSKDIRLTNIIAAKGKLELVASTPTRL